MKKLISVSGFKGSGKDTVGDHICQKNGYRKDSFADPLKDLCASIFNWPRDALEGDTPESRKWREEIDVWWAKELNIPDFSPRRAFQLIGTDVLRKHFHDGLWISSLKQRYEQSPTPVIVTDARFGNELTLIKELGGITVAVHRGNKPDWWDTAKILNTTDDLDIAHMALQNLEKMDIHASEYSWVGREVDYEIHNDSTLEDLYEKIDNLNL